MSRLSKRLREIAKTFDKDELYGVKQAVDTLKKQPAVKFDQSVDVSIKLGVDPRKADQNVRGTVSLPNGTGKTMRILVFARGEKVQEALDAGANYAGNDDLIKKVSEGWTDFDAVVATPDMMRDVGKLGKILGPRGLMPTPKAGTVTPDVAKAVDELNAGKIEFKVDKHAVVNVAIGKLSFTVDQLVENFKALFDAVMRAKPASSKGSYTKNVVLSSTMGPGLKIDVRQTESA